MLSRADLEKAILLAQAESYSIMSGFLKAWESGNEVEQDGEEQEETEEGLQQLVGGSG